MLNIAALSVCGHFSWLHRSTQAFVQVEPVTHRRGPRVGKNLKLGGAGLNIALTGITTSLRDNCGGGIIMPATGDARRGRGVRRGRGNGRGRQGVALAGRGICKRSGASSLDRSFRSSRPPPGCAGGFKTSLWWLCSPHSGVEFLGVATKFGNDPRLLAGAALLHAGAASTQLMHSAQGGLNEGAVAQQMHGALGLGQQHSVANYSYQPGQETMPPTRAGESGLVASHSHNIFLQQQQQQQQQQRRQQQQSSVESARHRHNSNASFTNHVEYQKPTATAGVAELSQGHCTLDHSSMRASGSAVTAMSELSQAAAAAMSKMLASHDRHHAGLVDDPHMLGNAPGAISAPYLCRPQVPSFDSAVLPPLPVKSQMGVSFLLG